MAKSFSARSGIDAFPVNPMDRWAEPLTATEKPSTLSSPYSLG